MKLYNAKEIAAMYGVSEKTARRYMHKMGCTTKPLRVTEAKIRAWDKLRELPPVDYMKAVRDYARERAAIMLQKRKVGSV